MGRMLRSSTLWEAVFDHLPAGILVLQPQTDADGAIVDFEVLAANNRMLELAGRTEESLLGHRISEIHPVFRQRGILARYERVLQRGVADEFEQLLPMNSGSRAMPGWFAITAIPTEGSLIVMMSSIDKRKSVLVEAVRMMNVDDLTGIGNRRLLKSHFWKHRQRNTGMALIYLDLNGFKLINDSHGHETGDEVLKIVAQRLRNSLRPGEAVARLGGDEFAVLLDTGDKAAAHAIGERLRTAISRPISIGEHSLGVATSLGIAFFPEDGTSFEALAASADRRMYRDKNGSRHQLRRAAAGESPQQGEPEPG